MFALYDQDHDGQLSLAEFQRIYCVEIMGQQDDNNSCVEANALFAEYAGEDSNLSEDEFKLIYYFYLQGSGKTLEDLFDEHDHHNVDDFISVDEFCHIYLNDLGILDCEAESAGVFAAFNGDDSDHLDEAEFSDVYQLFCQDCLKTEHEMYHFYDDDHDDELSLEEF
jgi:Ca2+-binding EF-hand superfamily protein